MKPPVDIEALKSEHARVKTVFQAAVLAWKSCPMDAPEFNRLAAAKVAATRDYKNMESKVNWHMRKRGSSIPVKPAIEPLNLSAGRYRPKLKEKPKCWRFVNGPSNCTDAGMVCYCNKEYGPLRIEKEALGIE